METGYQGSLDEASVRIRDSEVAEKEDVSMERRQVEDIGSSGPALPLDPFLTLLCHLLYHEDFLSQLPCSLVLASVQPTGGSEGILGANREKPGHFAPSLPAPGTVCGSDPLICGPSSHSKPCCGSSFRVVILDPTASSSLGSGRSRGGVLSHSRLLSPAISHVSCSLY